MIELGILEKDIEEKFIHSSAPGGQNVNKTATCVYLKHIPTGIEIKCQQERSQAQNRVRARELLTAKIEHLKIKEKRYLEWAAQKIIRQKRRSSKKTRETVLKKKHQHSEKKQQRRQVNLNEII